MKVRKGSTSTPEDIVDAPRDESWWLIAIFALEAIMSFVPACAAYPPHSSCFVVVKSAEAS
eukprot:8429928-Pyramimonas_sp.AAC.1